MAPAASSQTQLGLWLPSREGQDSQRADHIIEGWAEVSELTAEALAAQFADAGVTAIIHTDVDRDGVLAGPNIESTSALASATSIPVIASGGVSSLDDLLALRNAGNIAGAISGRALYDGRVNLGQAMKALC